MSFTSTVTSANEGSVKNNERSFGTLTVFKNANKAVSFLYESTFNEDASLLSASASVDE